ncbi:conserved hypothetical protein [Neospora caninum Liverpool]|uniref:Clusterin-associated protein 1 n=1 Tax=Neospora caninum (strain Liverpool) TaxID=572307 RepID=F0V797_NEOCL|nr:conserved hypothetical protein [Neospora caninum Liverpool]CBZ49588.1 conserved hypothetical protein [Neospora caninum Liverpool]|eukprot:XP_003879623.1 conserved hypothetical protein [Neospora caninum Liverpool]
MSYRCMYSSAASQLVDTGASLLQALGRHRRPERALLRRRVREFLQRLGLHLDGGADIEQEQIRMQLEEQLRRAKSDLQNTQRACLDLEDEVKRTNVALSRLTQDSDRAEKRLQSLQHLKPAFLEDRKKLMAELQETYDVYIACVRNERYLEMETEERQAKIREGLLEQQKLLQNLQQKIKEEAAAAVDCLFDGDTSEEEGDPEGEGQSRNSVRGKRRTTRASPRNDEAEENGEAGRQRLSEAPLRRQLRRRGDGEMIESDGSEEGYSGGRRHHGADSHPVFVLWFFIFAPVPAFEETRFLAVLSVLFNQVPRRRHPADRRPADASPACGEHSLASSCSKQDQDDSLFGSDGSFSEEERPEPGKTSDELDSQLFPQTDSRRASGKKRDKPPSLDFHTLLNIGKDTSDESESDEVLTATERRRAKEKAFRDEMEESLF